MSKNNRLLKIITILSFLLIIVSLILINRAQSVGYELSIYESTSDFVWLSLMGSIVGGVILIVHQALIKNEENNWWRLGFLILILCNFIILGLPAFKGYAFYSHPLGDPLVHVAYIKDIVFSGYVDSNNYYPITHILVRLIAELSSLQPIEIMMYFPNIFSIFFMISIYLLGTIVFSRKEQWLLSIAASAPFLFFYYNTSIYPVGLSTLLLPFVFYLFFKSYIENNNIYRILFLLFVILYPFFHPATSLMLIFFISIIELTKIIYIKISNHSNQIDGNFSINPILISLITFFTWIASFYLFGYTIRTILSWINQEMVQTHALSVTNKFQVFSGFCDKSFFIFRIAGDNIIYFVLSMITTLLLVKKIFNRQKVDKNIFIICSLFTFSFILTLFLFIGLRIEGLDVFRLANYLMLLTPILVGYALYEINQSIKKVSLSSIIIISILLIASFNSIFSVYQSPDILEPNWQITHMDIKGGSWFFNHKVEEIPLSGMDLSYRFVGLYFGLNKSLNRPDVIEMRRESWINPNGSIPDHFGYSHNVTRLGNTLSHKRYMAITQRFKTAHLDQKLSVRRWGQFDSEDFIQLTHDPTLIKIYGNGELDVWLI